jgi:hypothetical protein
MRSHSRRSFIQFSGKPLITANSSNVIQHIQSEPSAVFQHRFWGTEQSLGARG